LPAFSGRQAGGAFAGRLRLGDGCRLLRAGPAPVMQVWRKQGAVTVLRCNTAERQASDMPLPCNVGHESEALFLA
jgi:hypothetical protein